MTEVSYCSFCGRARNLRREEHQLGNFVRTVVTCETCHRTLSSTMGVATTDTPEIEQAPAQPDVAAENPAKPSPAAKAPVAKRAIASKTKPQSTKLKATKARATKTK
ncbi:MAG: hypothetical protein NVS1B3_12600 [Candidatus Dormibacteraceae bacterium]